MIRPAAITLELDAASIAALLPHREPLLLVDRLERFVPGSSPRLRAGLTLRGDEPVLRGHFPQRPIWPGAYQIEGLAQAAGLLLMLDALFERHGHAGLDALGSTTASELPGIGLLARVEASFLRVVEPPAVLRYELRLRGRQAGIARIDGQVSAGEHTTAEASLVVTLESPR